MKVLKILVVFFGALALFGWAVVRCTMPTPPQVAQSPAHAASIAAMSAEQKAAQAQYEKNKREIAEEQAAAEQKDKAASAASAIWTQGMRERVARGVATITANARDPRKVEWLSVYSSPSGTVCFEFVAPNAFGGPAHEFAALPLKNDRLLIGENARSLWHKDCAGTAKFIDHTALAKQLTPN